MPRPRAGRPAPPAAPGFRRVLGIDPGLSGALAVVVAPASPLPGVALGNAGRLLRVEAVHDLPTIAETTTTGKTRRRIDARALANLVARLGPFDRIAVERLVAPPGISAISGYAMGATAATIATVLTLEEMPFVLLSPNVWKRALDVPPDKEAARQWATQFFGGGEHWPRKKDHNRAEAAAIAAWRALAD